MADLTAVNPERLIRDVEAVTPGVMRAALQAELANVVRDFCRESLSLKDDASVVLPGGVSSLVLADVNGLKAIKVLSGRTEDGAMLVADPSFRNYSVSVNTSPRRYYCPSENVMVFDGAPQSDLGLTVVVAYCPRDDNATIPAELYEARYEVLKAGLLGRIYMHPAKPYTNLPAARLYLGSYRAGVTKAKVDAMQEGTIGDVPFRYPRWA